MNKQMSATELKTHIIDFLQEHNEGVLATSVNDMPRSSPVQYYFNQENLDIFIASAGGEKFNSIKQNTNVCLLVNSNYVDYKKIKGIQIFGQANISQENSLIKSEFQQLQNKNNIKIEDENLKIIKIIPEEFVYLDSLKAGDRTKQILKNNLVYLKEDK